jgi:hypothetical protein
VRCSMGVTVAAPRSHAAGARGQQVIDFPTYCAKVIAGIGSLPDTVADRSIPIRLTRRRKDEKVERFRKRHVGQVSVHLRDQLAAWASSPGVPSFRGVSLVRSPVACIPGTRLDSADNGIVLG